MANIIPRKNKNGEIISYRIRVFRGSDINGKSLLPYETTWKSDPSKSEKKNKTALIAAAEEFEKQCKNATICASNMRFDVFAQEYLKAVAPPAMSPQTYIGYKRTINNLILPTFGSMKLNRISPVHIQKWIDELTHSKKKRAGRKVAAVNESQNISPSTVRRYLNVIQSIFALAIKRDLLEISPARVEKLILPKRIKPKVEILSKNELSKVIECLEAEELKYRCAVNLALITGARRAEIVALTWEDIDEENYMITISKSISKVTGEKFEIKPPKDYETRTVSISGGCIDMLKELNAHQQAQAERLCHNPANKSQAFFKNILENMI